MIDTIIKHPKLTLLVLVLVMLVPNIGALDVTIMEARNLITAREMITDGNWLLTTMNGEARYQKPPLPTWFTALAMLIFGVKHLVFLRLPGILMVAITGIYVYLLSLKILGNKFHSLINGLIAITSFYIIGIIIEAPWDLFTHGFMLIAIVHLFQLFEKSESYWKHTLMAGICIGLSVMCKGPISVYALLLPFLIAYGFVYGYRQVRAKWFSFFSIVFLIVLVGSWWFLYVRLADPDTFLKIAEQETGNWANYNTRPIYYYWSFFTQSGIWTIPAFVGLLYPYLKSRVSNLKAYKLSLLWVVFAVILLSVVPEKKSRYLMPVLIPLAINTGFYIEYLISRFKALQNRSETIPVYLNFGLIGSIGLGFPILAFVLNLDLTGKYLFWFILAAIALFSIGLCMIIALKTKRMKSLFLLCVAFMMAAVLTLPPFATFRTQDQYKSASTLQVYAQDNDLKIYALGYVSPEMIWSYGDKIPQLQKSGTSIVFPDEPVFGLLIRELSPEEKGILAEYYDMSSIQTYDLNRSESGQRGHKDRLMNEFLILRKK